MSRNKETLESVVERIGPAKAREYLATMKVNRRLRRTWVEQLARMMKDGDFRLTHQGIAFNGDGSLKDGQHRLSAVVLSGCTVPMMVSRGLTEGAMEVIDIQARRTDADVMQILGHDVDHHMIAVAKRMRESISTNVDRRLTRTETIRFVLLHEPSIRFSLKGENGMGVGHAAVRAPIARAWYTRDRSRLQKFAECLGTGVMDGPEDQAAIALRNVILRHRGSLATIDRFSLYRKTEAALAAFLERRPLSKVYEVDRELFPLPEEATS